MQKTLYLFVPATRLDRVAKAADSGADVVVIDLEDAVTTTQKQTVRATLLEFDRLQTHHYWLRINAFGGQDFIEDMALCTQLKQLQGVVLPKCQSPEEVAHIYQKLQLPVIAMIETAVGIRQIAQIAQAPGLYTLSFGRLDLLQSLGVRLGSQAAARIFDEIRYQLLIHAHANRLQPPIETIFMDFEDSVGLMRCVHHWRDFGFGGQLLIHPKQVAIVRQALASDDAQRQFAEKIWQTYQQTGQSVFAVDGQMVDLPLIVWSAQLLGHPLDGLGL